MLSRSTYILEKYTLRLVQQHTNIFFKSRIKPADLEKTYLKLTPRCLLRVVIKVEEAMEEETTT